jgi:phosphopentomutase
MTAGRHARAIVIVLDSAGCGASPDAASYGDQGADTLGHTADFVDGLALPTLARWGLGNLTTMRGVAAGANPFAAYGRLREASVGKDTTTGHWEMCGVITLNSFATFPDGFPPELIRAFEQASGRRVIGNRPASGTVILDELGEAHMKSGALILYTSADSVFQVAAHEDLVPVAELHDICTKARHLCDPYRIGRVIARPFVGGPGAFVRTYNRKDFAMPAPAPTLCDHVAQAGQPVIGIGKIPDIFSQRGITESVHTAGDADGLAQTAQAMDRLERGLIFTNLVDFDMLYGHRRDPAGYARALRLFDAFLPELQARLRPGDLLALTADHGTDPTAPGTDHTREEVPLLVAGARASAAALGTRPTFADLGQTMAEHLGVAPLTAGTSFLRDIA